MTTVKMSFKQDLSIVQILTPRQIDALLASKVKKYENNQSHRNVVKGRTVWGNNDVCDSNVVCQTVRSSVNAATGKKCKDVSE